MGISLDRCSAARALDGRTSGRSCSLVIGSSRIAKPTQNSHFGQIRPGRVRAAVLKRRLQRALALQLLAKSNRLRKGGCALKRLSEDFRVCHGRGWLDQGALRHWPMSRGASFLSSSYRPIAAPGALAKPRSRRPDRPASPVHAARRHAGIRHEVAGRRA